jgi:hypothetical protein
MSETGERLVADALGEVRTELATVRTELATVRTTLELLVAHMNPQLADHEQRVRTLEQNNTELRTQFRVWLALASAVSTGGGGGIGVLLSHLTGGA